MKKVSLLFAVLVLIAISGRAQVQRELVAVEITTSTVCTYCPGAALGLEDLYSNGCRVAGIEHHNNWQGTDPFVTTASQARSTFYNPGGNPGAFFDGVLSVVGGNHTSTMYASYLPKYTERIAIPSPIKIGYTMERTGQQFTFHFTITKVAALTNLHPVLQFTVTQSNIVYSWEGQSELNFVNRLMLPDANGTPLDFSSSDVQNVTLVANIDPMWPLADIEFVAFVQDMTSKEIHNCARPVMSDFGATTTTSICPNNSVTFANTSIGRPASTKWYFPGGSPSTYTTGNTPSIIYTDPGSYDVTMVTTTGLHTDSIVKPGFITVSPGAATSTPDGSNKVCTNNANQTTTYTTLCPGATSYEWEVYPTGAGTITNNGASCTVLWTNNWYGTASIRAQATNSCGVGDWSDYFDVKCATCVGVEDFDAQGVKVFPNPASTEMNVLVKTSTPEDFTLKLVNSVGNVVYTKAFNSTGSINHNFDIKNFADGMYFLRVEGKKQNYTQKVTIKH